MPSNREDRESFLNFPIEQDFSPILDRSKAPASLDDNKPLDAGFLDDLKRSWVYRRNAAFRLSTFSSDRHSTTWSCLSDMTVSEVSNISVFSLVITVEEVNNPHRLSQTWSNDQALPLWPFPSWPSIPSKSTPYSTIKPKKLSFEKLSKLFRISPPAALPQSDDEISSIETVKEPPESASIDLANDLSSTNSGNTNLGPAISPISNTLEDLEQDDLAYPCKGCGEMSLVTTLLDYFALNSMLTIACELSGSRGRQGVRAW